MQRIRPDLLGFVFHLSWLYLLLYSSAIDQARTDSLVAIADVSYLASAVALAPTMAVGVFCTKRFMRACESRAGVAAAPALTAMGTVLYCAAQLVTAPELVLAGGALTGIGSGMMAARWASVFGAASARAVIENLPTLLAVIVVICASVSYVPFEARMVLVVALPILSGAALQYARSYQRDLMKARAEDAASAATDERTATGSATAGETTPERQNKPAYEERDPKNASAKLTFAQIVLVALMGSTMAMLPALAAAGFDYSALFYALSGLFVLLFCAVSIARGDKGSLFVLFAAPSLVLLAALPPLLNYGNNVGSALQPVGNIAFELVLVFGCALFARASNASPARTFMIGRLTLAVSDLAGSWVGVLIYASADNVIAAQTAGIVLFAACELMLLALVIAFLVSERGKKLGRWSGEANAGVGALTTNGTEAATELTQGGPAAATHAAQPAPADAARRHLDAIAERYGLSERERDVFALLAEGRTNARIGDDLCIAPGTVNYHTRNIYSKLGVHSRQELIDLVQSSE